MKNNYNYRDLESFRTKYGRRFKVVDVQDDYGFEVNDIIEVVDVKDIIEKVYNGNKKDILENNVVLALVQDDNVNLEEWNYAYNGDIYEDYI